MSQPAVAKVENGLVKVYNSGGSQIGSIATGVPVQSAVVVGDEIHITRKDGKIQVTTVGGAIKRII